MIGPAPGRHGRPIRDRTRSGPMRGGAIIHPFRRGGVVWPLLAFAILVWLRPVGLGDADGERYVREALAWLDGGPRLGETHWALRYPLVLPLVGSLAAFGPSNVSAVLPNLLAAVALILVSFGFGRALLGPRAGFLLSALVAVSTILTLGHVEVGIEGIEILWTALSLWLLASALMSEGPRGGRLAVAGLAAGLAWLCRETAAFLPVVFVLAGLAGAERGGRWRAVGLPLAGFAAVIAAELAVYAALTGDPFYRYRIDMNHGSPGGSTESGLLAEVSRGDYLDLITDPLSRIFLHPVFGPMALVILAASVWLVRHRRALPLAAARSALLFAVGGLGSLGLSALVLSLESPNYYPILVYAGLLAVSLALDRGMTGLGDRAFLGLAAALVAIGATLSSLQSGYDVHSIRAATDMAARDDTPALTGSEWTARRVETNLRLRGVDAARAAARVDWSDPPGPGDRVLLIRLVNDDLSPGPGWILLEEAHPPPPGIAALLRAILPSRGLPGPLRSALYPPGGAALYAIGDPAPAE